MKISIKTTAFAISIQKLELHSLMRTIVKRALNKKINTYKDIFL